MSASYWRHDEYDSDGKLAARYESFEERSAESGATTSGWHKYDQSGKLLHVSEKPRGAIAGPIGVLLNHARRRCVALQASAFLV